jgi:hypothetical protein
VDATWLTRCVSYKYLHPRLSTTLECLVQHETDWALRQLPTLLPVVVLLRSNRPAVRLFRRST